MISVIIPAYNIEEYIGECIESVLAQSGVEMEIIVVDDGSTDATPAIVDEYAARHGHIKVIHRTNGGLAAARNTALEHCTGDWITMVDGDDLLMPGALALMLKAANDTEADMVMGAYADFTDVAPAALASADSSAAAATIISGRQAVETMLYRRGPTATVHSSAWGKLYRRELWEHHTFKAGILYEDLEVVPRISLNARRVAVVDDIVYAYRYNSNSILHVFTPNRLDVIDVARSLVAHFIDDKPLHRAAQSRLFSAAFNMWLLLVVNHADMPDKLADCKRIVRRLAPGQLFRSKVRFKNRIGAILQYFPFLFRSAGICKKLLPK